MPQLSGWPSYLKGSVWLLLGDPSCVQAREKCGIEHTLLQLNLFCNQVSHEFMSGNRGVNTIVSIYKFMPAFIASRARPHTSARRLPTLLRIPYYRTPLLDTSDWSETNQIGTIVRSTSRLAPKGPDTYPLEAE